MVASRPNPTLALIDELLAEQSRLQTPVARFASTHSDDRPSSLSSQLIPLSAPKPGEQYAFEVELDACTGCKACVSACHALNGLDDTESWRDVGLVMGGSYAEPYQQTITTACHHCADPACLNGCPVLAYEKDPVTGIVRHLDDQCIGCQYCVLKCPYDVPKYNDRLGIVRKCDMCHQRLGAGEAPACVQACPTNAIRIVTVSVHTSSGRPGISADLSAFLPTAPDPEYTQPTTRYVSNHRAPANATAADLPLLRPQPAHWPLAVMLTLLPLAVGCLGVANFFPPTTSADVTYYVTLAGWLAGAAGLASSVFHLGQPLRAWRIFLGWRKSWLSREAMVFGAWFGVTTLSLLAPAFLPLATVTGGLGLLCSVMLYVDTRRQLWRWTQTAPRLLGSAVVLGAAVACVVGLGIKTALVIIAATTVLKLMCDARLIRPLDQFDEDAPPTPIIQSARLLGGPLRSVFGVRLTGALLTLLLLPLLADGARFSAGSWGLLAGVLLGELAERYLFFRAVDAPKMPGAVA